MRISLFFAILLSIHSLSHSIRWSTGGIVRRYNNIGQSKNSGFNFPLDGGFNGYGIAGFRRPYDSRPPNQFQTHVISTKKVKSSRKRSYNHERRVKQNNAYNQPNNHIPSFKITPSEPKYGSSRPQLKSNTIYEPPKQYIPTIIITPANSKYSAQQPPQNIATKIIIPSHSLVQYSASKPPPKPDIGYDLSKQKIVTKIIIPAQTEYSASKLVLNSSVYETPKENIPNIITIPTQREYSVPQSPFKQNIVYESSIENNGRKIIIPTQPEYNLPQQSFKSNIGYESSINSNDPKIIIPTQPEYNLPEQSFKPNIGYESSIESNGPKIIIPAQPEYSVPQQPFKPIIDYEPLKQNIAPNIISNIQPKYSEPKPPNIVKPRIDDSETGILWQYQFIGNPSQGFSYTKNYKIPYYGSVYGYALPSFGRKYESRPSNEYSDSPKPPKSFKASTGGIVWRYNNLGYLKYGLPYKGYKLPYDSSVFGYGIPCAGKTYNDIRKKPVRNKSVKIASTDGDVWKYNHVGYEKFGLPHSGYTIPYDSSVFGYGIPYFDKSSNYNAEHYGTQYLSADNVNDKYIGYKSPYYNNIYGFGVPFFGNEGVCNDSHQRYLFDRLGILVCNDLRRR